jgi:predicted site-specific integrase-resolvase
MTKIRAAFYARVSGEQQATANTIRSQIAALSDRAQSDGTAVPPELQFVDDGFSGATLIRPALDRLRDLVSIGTIDRIYVHSPDRLARNYAYQVLLIDEWRRRGVELVFLNRALGESPEDDLLLQVQGIIAEYERAKIMERSRRGKKHAAQRGSVNVMSAAPFGYRYVSVQEGVAKHDLSRWRSRQRSSNRFFPGSLKIVVVSQKFAVDFTRPVNSPLPGSERGHDRQCGMFCRTQLIGAMQRTGKHT